VKIAVSAEEPGFTLCCILGAGGSVMAPGAGNWIIILVDMAE